jgi:aspartate/glutamate racemase
MPQHIGIVACSSEGAALCYRTISLEGSALLGKHYHPEVSLHNHSLGEYMKFIEADDWAGVAELMLSSAEKLAKAGADFFICPDNTIHQAFDLVEHRSLRPWMHIAKEVASETVKFGYKRIGVLGTRYLMEGPVYPEKLQAVGLEFRIPGPQEREKMNQIATFACILHRGHPRVKRRRLQRSCPRLHRNSFTRDTRFFAAPHARFHTIAGPSCLATGNRELKANFFADTPAADYNGGQRVRAHPVRGKGFSHLSRSSQWLDLLSARYADDGQF